MAAETSLDYPTICQYVGQLFLETRNQLQSLTEALEATQRERDEALARLIPKKPE